MTFDWLELAYVVLAALGGGALLFRRAQGKKRTSVDAAKPDTPSDHSPDTASTLRATHAETDAEILESDARATATVGGAPVAGSDPRVVADFIAWADSDD